jgi:hypothetical protein
MGQNYKLLIDKFNMHESEVYKLWKTKCESEADTMRMAHQIIEA